MTVLGKGHHDPNERFESREVGLVGALMCERPHRVAFAGPWFVWKDPDGTRIPSCAIVTATANDLPRLVHDCMPVILPRDTEEFWLDCSVNDARALRSVMTSYADDATEAYEVSTLVDSTANDAPRAIGPHCMTSKEGALIERGNPAWY